MIISINGEITPREDATIDILSESVMFGAGVFETLRTFNGRKTLRLEEHIKRLFDSIRKLSIQIPYSSEDVIRLVRTVIRENDAEYQRVKVMAFDGKLIVTSVPLTVDSSIDRGVSLKSVKQRRALPEIKATSYLDCLLSYRSAQKEGYYDALLLDESGYVYEGSRSNIFWVENGRLVTREKQVLPGITRDIILDCLSPDIRFENIHVDQLIRVDEIFITNSIIGICPVLAINHDGIGDGSVGSLTQSLREQYNYLLND